jgi:hypothetical protein
MKLLRIAPALAAVAAVSAFGADSAFAGGNAGPPVYPSFVNVQMVQTETLLGKASTYEDEADSAKAVTALTAAVSHMHKAWLAEKFYIDNAPPPVAASGSVKTALRKAFVPRKSKVKARASGGAIPGASPFADQYTTGVGVLTLQHDVAEAAFAMLDHADATVLPVLSKALFAALNDRDTAIAYIHSVDTPPVAESGNVKAKGHASGAPVTSGWASVMPGVLPYVDDELTAIDNLNKNLKLSPGRKRLLDDAELQDTKTERTINTYWPPVPPAG